MSERKKIVNEVRELYCVNTLIEFAYQSLQLDPQTESGITMELLLALAWITGAHFGLAFPETTLPLLAESDEVYCLVRDMWVNWVKVVGSDLPPEKIQHLVQCAIEAERFQPLASLVPKDFSIDLKSN